MTVEDRVRAATRERAGLVREIRPLELPEGLPDRRPSRPGVRRWPHWSAPAWAAPAAAAAVVVALAIALVAVRQLNGGPSASPAAPTASPAEAPGIVPRYYAALDDPGGLAFSDPFPNNVTTPVRVLVGDARTGGRVATVSPPRGQSFVGVTAAADDRTFVLAAETLPVESGVPSGSPVAWYRLRIDPGGAHPATLTRLSIPGEPAGTQVSGIALSPNGRQLAVMFQVGTWATSVKQVGPLTLSVYSVSTGKAVRTWTQPTKGFAEGYGWYWGRYSNTSLTWLAGGHTLGFEYGGLTGENGPPTAPVFGGIKVRTIDLNRPSGALLADSKVVFTPRNHWCMSLQLTADGKTVICGSYYGNTKVTSAQADPEITDYSVATGKARLAYRLGGAYQLGLANILWASPDGSTLVGSALTQRRYSDPVDAQLKAGVIAKGVLTPLSFPLGVPLVGEVAF